MSLKTAIKRLRRIPGAIRPTTFLSYAITLTAFVALFNMVMCIAFNNWHGCYSHRHIGTQIRNATISPILIAGPIQIGLPHNSNNRKTFLHELAKLLFTDRSMRTDRGASCLNVACRSILRNDGLVTAGKHFRSFVYKPLISALQSIIPHKNVASTTGSKGGRFSIVSIMKIKHDLLIWDEWSWLGKGNQIRTLVLVEQGLSRFPLDSGNDHATQGNKGHKSTQEDHPSIRVSGFILQVCYSVLEALVALALVMYAHKQLVKRWSFRAFLLLVWIYLVAAGLIFHAAQNWLF